MLQRCSGCSDLWNEVSTVQSLVLVFLYGFVPCFLRVRKDFLTNGIDYNINFSERNQALFARSASCLSDVKLIHVYARYELNVMQKVDYSFCNYSFGNIFPLCLSL